jgi:hypothetical protein
MLADFGWKIESAGNWLKIKHYFYFDFDTFFVSQTQLEFAIAVGFFFAYTTQQLVTGDDILHRKNYL